MKISWPKLIILAYLTFIGGMLFMVTQSFRQNTQLEYEDYYQREVDYQGKIDAKNRVKSLKDSPDFLVENDTVFLKIPAHITGFQKGTWFFYYITNDKKDFALELKSPEENIPVKNLEKGLYRLEVSWENQNVLYYFDKELYIK